MASLAGIDTATARALRFNILTAVRSGETLGATWEEITEIDGLPVWVIPAARMKARRDHRVPLSAAARAALGERGEGLIFRSRVGSHGRLGHSVMNDLLSELRPNVATVHGFRSTFRDWVGEATDYPRDLAEIALAHSLGNATEQAYARGDQLEKRRPLMNDWAAFATG
jgi:integrase